MPYFNFQATNASGEMVSGIVEAENESASLALVRDQGLEPVSVSERRIAPWQANLDFLQRISTKDLVIMSRQLAVMVDATVPLVDALHILTKQTSNAKLKGIISEVADEVEGGARLSLAFGRYPKLFSKFYISIIRSGETSGQLSEVLNYLAEQLEKDYDLRSKIISAMMYPAFIISGLFAVGLLMMVYVVPKMTEILKEANTALPISTRLLIGLSDFLVAYWWLVLLVLVVGISGFLFALRYKKVRYAFDWFKIKVPIFGTLVREIAVVRMTQSLSTLSAGKVPIADALVVVKDIVGNAVYEEMLEETIRGVRDGNTIASVFTKKKEIPDMVSQLISVGEETGRLDEILVRLTGFYNREIDNLVRNLVTLIEPLVMIVMGVAVGVMVAAIILPMYTLSTSL